MKRCTVLCIMLIVCFNFVVFDNCAKAADLVCTDAGFYDATGNRVPDYYDREEVCAKFTIANNSSEKEEVMFVCAIYNNNKLTETFAIAYDTVGAKEIKNFKMDLSEINISINDTVRLFVWTKDIAPLYEVEYIAFVDAISNINESDTKRLFVPATAYLSANTLVPENFSVFDSNGEALAVDNVYYYPGKRIIALDVIGGVNTELCTILSNRVKNVSGYEFNISENKSITAQFMAIPFETSVRSLQLIKDNIAVSKVENDGIYELSTFLTNEAKNKNLMLHIIRSNGKNIETLKIIPVEGNEKFTADISLRTGDTVYVALRPDYSNDETTLVRQ